MVIKQLEETRILENLASSIRLKPIIKCLLINLLIFVALKTFGIENKISP